jgi:hypothetical protein
MNMEKAVQEVQGWARGTVGAYEKFNRPQALSLSVRLVTKGFDRCGHALMRKVENEIMALSRDIDPLVFDLSGKEEAELLVRRVVENVPELQECA